MSASLDGDYTWWPDFYEFHKLAIDELDAFDYDEYKANDFHVKEQRYYPLSLMDKPE